jgi:hypothetical protein
MSNVVNCVPFYTKVGSFCSFRSQHLDTLYLLRVLFVLQPLSYFTCHHATQKACLYHLYRSDLGWTTPTVVTACAWVNWFILQSRTSTLGTVRLIWRWSIRVYSESPTQHQIESVVGDRWAASVPTDIRDPTRSLLNINVRTYASVSNFQVPIHSTSLHYIPSSSSPSLSNPITFFLSYPYNVTSTKRPMLRSRRPNLLSENRSRMQTKKWKDLEGNFICQPKRKCFCSFNTDPSPLLWACTW